MVQTEDRIAEHVASEGFTPSTDEPTDRDYRYIAEKVADRVVPLHYSEDGLEGRGDEDHEAMARAHVYRLTIDGFDSWPKFARHLKYTEGVTDALGLEHPRSRETLRTSWQDQFDGVRERLRELALDIRDEIGWGMDGVLMAMGVDDSSQSFPEFTEEGIRNESKDRAYKRIRPILTDIVDFDRADNTSVPAEDLTEYAGWLARRRKMTPESMDAYVADEDLDDRPFDPETYRQAIRKKERQKTQLLDGRTEWVPPRSWSVDLYDEPGGTDDWHSTTEEGIERFVEELKDEDVIDGEVPVCIDGSIRSWHKHPDGADKRPDGVYQESYFDTNYGWKDISANAIIDGRAVVLANISMVPGDKFFQAVKYLIDRSTELLDVEAFYADAEFSNTDICRYIHHIGEYYDMRKSHRSRVKAEFESFTGKADWTNGYEMRSPRKGMTHKTNLYAVEKRGQIGVKKGETRHEDHKQSGLEDFGDAKKATGQLTFDDLADDDDDTEYVAFVTNKDIDSEGIDPEANPLGHNNENTVWGHAERYRQRWSIETAFRQVKYQFLPNTRARDLGTRRFVWMMGIILLNAWATLNLFVQTWAAQTFDEDDTDPPVPGKEMLEELAKTEYG